MSTKLTYKNVHNRFKLNGIHFNGKELCDKAFIFIKEGEIHEKALGTFILEWFDGKDYIEMTTSGTTGAPKTIQLKKAAMVNSALATGDFFDLKPGDSALHCLPIQYIAGKMMLVRAFILGLELDYVLPDSHPLDVTGRKYDFAAMVPLQVEQSLLALDLVKKVIIGGAKINATLAEKLKALPIAVYETYGMTETITHIAAKKVQDMAFTILPGIAIHTDERGCLVIDAPRVCDHSLVTNDMVNLVDDTHFIWLGRYDNVINSGGVKLFPEQIEEKLATAISHRFFVIGKEDATLGEKLVLVVESEPYTIAPEVFDRLEKFEKPKEIIFVPHFKETETGKVKRRETLA
ncbi:AMP-binding protein [Flavobacterium cerinum]|uniref:AMP-binding protein n=1 Tax=Flavobacterium cerinum TaxID=2502784 RepID=A0ABY5IQH7_9FLAO|nr:AMP-binding protein [Flavobacterium cerinum]UUC45088.1 AMP-binding protein [Flavobacterium cerinum]